MRLNEKAIKRLAPPTKGNVITYDDTVPGFGLRVTANNARSFILTYWINGRQRRLTIGRWPAWTTTAAREQAKALKRQIDQGEDPLATKATQRDAPTFAKIAREYLARHAINKKTGHVDKATLERDVLPHWGREKAAALTRQDVLRLIETKAETAPIAANRLLALIRKLLNWAVSRDLLNTNPCLQITPPGTERQRDRVLTPNEIRTFWTQLDTARMSDPVKRILRLILITAQRPGELCELETAELDNTWWTVPADKAKNGLAHRVPLTTLARTQLQPGKSRWLFPSPRGDQPLNVAALSHAVRLNRTHLAIPHFTPHDLRRTAASHMASNGTPRLVIQKILNHVETGVTSVYERYTYDNEKQQALTQWERHLTRILEGKEAKVVPIRTRPSTTGRRRMQ